MQKVLKRIVAWIGIILLGMVIILNLMYNVELNVYESAIIMKNIIWLSLIYIMLAYDIYRLQNSYIINIEQRILMIKSQRYLKE